MNKLIFLLLLTGLLQLVACSNTLEGVGKDMQDMGKSIEDSVKSNKQED